MHGFRVDVVVTSTGPSLHLAQDEWQAVADAVRAIQVMADDFNQGRIEEPPPVTMTLADLAGGAALARTQARPQKRPRRVTRGNARRKS